MKLTQLIVEGPWS